VSNADPNSELFNLARIQQLSGIGTLHFEPSMSSTSDMARKILGQLPPDLPLLVLTDRQTAGRGQQNRTWWAGPGALTFSWVPSFGLQPKPYVISLAVAMAVVVALDSHAMGLDPKIKWPNDVYVGRKKIAGILIESVIAAGARFLVFGIGVNANNSPAEAPPEIKSVATSLRDLLGRQVDLNQLLIAIIAQLNATLSQMLENPDEIIEVCLNRSIWKIGDPVGVDTQAGKIQGSFAGFGPGGQLLIRTNGSVLPITSGTIVEI
jgi:BirA family biotin operon repressor/biotin-[acetyl-CoA-carboxylase] ligase